MTEKLTAREHIHLQDILERLDTLQVRIELATRKTIISSGDFHELLKAIAKFRTLIEDINSEAQILDAYIERRQWQERDEGK